MQDDNGVTDTTSKAPLPRLERIFQAQKAGFAAAPYPSADQRRAQLRRLKTQIQRYQDLLAQAMNADFGHRSAHESKMFDLLGSVMEINHLIRHLGRWMRARRRPTELIFKTNTLRVTYQPKGVVGVIAPWNFPVYLTIGPLAAALAAGNRVMVKMAEDSRHTARVMVRMLAEIFDESEVAVIPADQGINEAFTALPFDHMVFTGSSAVGRKVMAAAAQNLVPVTLELGGKSPAIVAPGSDMADAARRIVHGKGSNCGQICVAPDYALVPRAEVAGFTAAAERAWQNLFPDAKTTRIINDRQFARLTAMLEDARAKGATIRACAPGTDAASRQMALHLILDPTPEMEVMQHEIFGPLLPVVGYDTPEQAIAHVTAGPRPLALYLFGADPAMRDDVLRRTHSGGVTLDDWGWHVVNHAAPFGGIGQSGMGSYHGIEGFRELSHARTVFHRQPWFPSRLFQPPYGTLPHRLTLRWFLGKPDRTLK